MWMLQVLLYGVLKGSREIVKKKSLEKNSVMEVLFFYTLFAFLLVTPCAKSAMGVPLKFMGAIFLKSIIIFSAWILSFHAIKKMPISLYGVLDLSRVLFATLLGCIVLREVMSIMQIIGLILVSAGLLLLRFKRKTEEKQESGVSTKIVLCALLSCMLNAFSGLLDKVLMKDLNSSQLQFWYMLFLVLLYAVYLIVVHKKVEIKKAVSNPWIWMLAILFVIADRSLFVANADPNSKITIMTLIKQSGCLVTLAAGKWMYHDKNILHKAICTAIVVAGIVVAVL